MAKKALAKITAKGRGKAFLRSLDSAKKRVRESDEYFIKRHGGWFRPGAHGYTDDIAQAGKFHGRDAVGFLDAEGVTLIPVAAMVDEIWKQVQASIARAAALSQIVEHY